MDHRSLLVVSIIAYHSSGNVMAAYNARRMVGMKGVVSIYVNKPNCFSEM